MASSETATTFHHDDNRRLSFVELLAAASAAQSSDGANPPLAASFSGTPQNQFPFGRPEGRSASPFGALAASSQFASYPDGPPMRSHHRAASDVSTSSVAPSPYLGPSSPAHSAHAGGPFVEEPLTMEGDFASLDLERATQSHAPGAPGPEQAHADAAPKRYDTLSWAKEHGAPSREDTVVLGNQGSYLTPGTGGLRPKESVTALTAAFEDQQRSAPDVRGASEGNQNHLAGHSSSYSDAPYVSSPSSSPSTSAVFSTDRGDASAQRPPIPTIRAPTGPTGPGATSPTLRLDMNHPALSGGPSISLTSATPLTARPETQRSGTHEFQRVLESLARDRRDVHMGPTSDAQAPHSNTPSHLLDPRVGRPRVRQRSKSDSGATDLNYLAQLGIVSAESALVNAPPQYGHSGTPVSQAGGQWSANSPFLGDQVAAAVSYPPHSTHAWSPSPWTQAPPIPGVASYPGTNSPGILPSVGAPGHWNNIGLNDFSGDRQHTLARPDATNGNLYPTSVAARRTLSAGSHRRGRSDGSLPTVESTSVYMHNGMLAPGLQPHSGAPAGMWLPGPLPMSPYDSTSPGHPYGSPTYPASSPSAVSVASGASPAGSHPGSPYARERSWSYSSMGSGHGSYHDASHAYNGGGVSPGANSTGFVDYQSKTTAATKAAAAKRRKEGVEARYICDMCGESFTRAYNLRGHQRAHKGEKPFHCGYPGCDKSFARQHDRKRHYKLHLGVKDYNCGACGKAFIRLDALQRHLRADAGQSCFTSLKASGEPLPAGLDLDSIRDNACDEVVGGGVSSVVSAVC